MKTNKNCNSAFNIKHHRFWLCWFQLQWVLWLTHCGQIRQLQQLQQLSRKPLMRFLRTFLSWSIPNLFSFKKQNWRMGPISSSSSTKHDNHFHICGRHTCRNPVQQSDLILETLTLSPATPLCPTWPSSPCGYGCVSQECRENVWISGH